MRCFMTQIYRPQLKNVLFVAVLFVLSVFTVRWGFTSLLGRPENVVLTTPAALELIISARWKSTRRESTNTSAQFRRFRVELIIQHRKGEASNVVAGFSSNHCSSIAKVDFFFPPFFHLRGGGLLVWSQIAV